MTILDMPGSTSYTSGFRLSIATSIQGLKYQELIPFRQTVCTAHCHSTNKDGYVYIYSKHPWYHLLWPSSSVLDFFIIFSFQSVMFV